MKSRSHFSKADTRNTNYELAKNHNYSVETLPKSMLNERQTVFKRGAAHVYTLFIQSNKRQGNAVNKIHNITWTIFMDCTVDAGRLLDIRFRGRYKKRMVFLTLHQCNNKNVHEQR